MAPHPLQQLSYQETVLAKDVIIAEHDQTEVILLRQIFLEEPPKAELRKFLALEHAGGITESSPRPSRLARCQYDVIGSEKIPFFHEAVVDINKKASVLHEVVGKEHQAPLIL